MMHDAHFILNHQWHYIPAIKMEILLKPVATVRNSRKTPTDDFWGEIISEIELCDHIPDEALEGISDF
jgi:hypothetical protein